ncbi:MAG: biotin transporter BioY [Blautia sp.]|nr:biotin transporter BioY [Blautia sp.]
MMNNKKISSFKTTDLVYIAICAVLLAVCSWISIPTLVPFTMQTFGVFFVLMFLGGKRGTAAIVVFILLGAVGVPVFAGFSGGIGILLGTTGGYIIGFIVMGIIYWLTEAFIGDSLVIRIIFLVIGLAACYAFGTAWFMAAYAKNAGAIGLGTALSWCVIPFIIPDLVKMALAVLVAERVKKAVRIR